MAKDKKRKVKEAFQYFIFHTCILAFIAGLIAFGTWYEVNKWHVYQYTHHTDIGYWKWQFFVNTHSSK